MGLAASGDMIVNRKQGRDRQCVLCPRCHQPTMTAVYDDNYGNTARIILPHRHCGARFTIYTGRVAEHGKQGALL